MNINKYIFLLFLTIISSHIIISAKENQVYEILNNWNRLESKFKEVAYKKLLISLEEDQVLKNDFLKDDSANLKKLKTLIRPILRLKKEPQVYVEGKNVFDFFEFDTIEYQSVAQYYLDNELLFVITRGHRGYDILPGSPGNTLPDWCPGDFYFISYYLKSPTNYLLCTKFEHFLILPDSLLIFYIDFMSDAFVIDSNKIMLYPYKYYQKHMKEYFNKPLEYILSRYPTLWVK